MVIEETEEPPLDGDQRAEALRAFEEATARPMLVLSLLLVALLALPLLVDLTAEQVVAVSVAVGLIWVVFVAELGVRLYLAPRRGRYLLAHWYDAVIVLLPLLRPLRVLLILTASRRAMGSWREVLTRHGLQHALLAAFLLVIAAAVGVWYFERGAGGSITGFGAALWWAVATVSAVGYGDVTPVTAGGRIVAVVLMLVGIAIFSLVTANVAAFLLRSGERGERQWERDDPTDAIRRLETQVAALRRQVDDLASAIAARPPAETGPHPNPASPAEHRERDVDPAWRGGETDPRPR